MKHIFIPAKNHGTIFDEEESFQAPKSFDYKVGDIIILSPNQLWDTFEITSKKEIKLALPTVSECIEKDGIFATEVHLKNKIKFINKCRTITKKEEYIKKEYPKLFENFFGKKSFNIGEDGFIYSFKTVEKNILNLKCNWTQIESSHSVFTTECGHESKEIGDFKYCPWCSGEIKNKPLFHIEGEDEYSNLMQEIKDELYKNESDIHYHTNTLFFIEKVVANYSEKLNFKKVEILKALMANRSYSASDYYQEVNMPLIDNNVAFYKNLADFTSKVNKEKGFKCGNCKQISQESSECTECGYKTYGFLTVGQHYSLIFKDDFLENPVVYRILVPVSLEGVHCEL